MQRHFSAEEAAFTMYRFFLAREPDPEGLSNLVAALHAGATLEEAMREMARSKEFRDRLYQFLRTLD